MTTWESETVPVASIRNASHMKNHYLKIESLENVFVCHNFQLLLLLLKKLFTNSYRKKIFTKLFTNTLFYTNCKVNVNQISTRFINNFWPESTISSVFWIVSVSALQEWLLTATNQETPYSTALTAWPFIDLVL